MGTFGSRRGSAEKLTLPLMILAFAAVGGFLYWLNLTAQPTESVVLDEDMGPAFESGASAILPAIDFLLNPAAYAGQVVEVTGARVATRLGTQAFWIGPDDSPFLVKMAPALLEAGTEVMVQTQVTVVGSVLMMTDSIVAAWDAAGAFPTEGEKFVAEFAVGSNFIEATTVMVPGAPAAGGAGGEGGGS